MQRARTHEAKDARRLALTEAALDEFFERGFSAARMDDIARRAGVSKGTLYLYFDSKEALFAALVEAYAAPNVERLAEVAAHAPTASAAIQGMVRLAPHIIRTSRAPRLMKILVGDAHSFPELVRRYRRRIIDRVLETIAATLRRAHEAGEVVVEDPELTARLVIAPIAFSALWHVVFGADRDAAVDLDRLFELHGRMLEAALTPGPASPASQGSP